MIKRYVVGFLFHKETGDVALIHKNRPDWQAGKMNGVGGHIHDGELPIDAMKREFKEEAGIDIEDWDAFALFQGKGYEVHLFRAVCDTDTARQLKTCTDEEVEWVPSTNICERLDVIHNLRWVIPLAKQSGNFRVIYIDEEEY